MGMRDFFQHVFLVLASLAGLIGTPLPVPLPPLPEDPALVRAAPADCNLFVEWFGSGAPVAGTGNRSERLAAEPEVRQLVERLLAAARGVLAAEVKPPELRDAVLQLFDLLRA